MNSYQYYLVSYYARLKGNGFGFGRKYISVNSSKEFMVDEIELDVAKEADLDPNNICVISRVRVSAEEYTVNTERAIEVIAEMESIDAEANTINQGDGTSQEGLREQLDGSSEVNTDREQTQGTTQEA
jgi:hypothetical protein